MQNCVPINNYDAVSYSARDINTNGAGDNASFFNLAALTLVTVLVFSTSSFKQY